ncbi:MAG: hypothetical protein ACYCO9_17480 [Streptosporangiaceae bacterium]
MSKIALIILAAVVALIIIVVLTGMRYLRADDEGLDADDSGVIEDTGSFEDTGGFGLSLDDSDQRHDRAGARQRSGRSAAASGRSQETTRNRAEARRPTRGETSHRTEDGPGWRGGPGAPRPDLADAGHGGGREETMRRGRGGVSRTEREHGSRSGRGHGDAGDLVPVAGRPRQGADARPTGRPSADGTGRGRRAISDVIDIADEADFTDGGASQARRRDREDRPPRAAARQAGDSRGGRSPDRASADRASADRASADRASGGRAGPGRGAGRRPPVRAMVDSGPLPEIRPRSGRGKKEAGDWPSGQWEQLSDADYWAELASDRSLTEPGGPPSGRADDARTDASRADASRAGRGRASGGRGDAARADVDRRDDRLDRIDAAPREVRPRERVSRPRHDEVGYGTAVGGYPGGRPDYERIEAADRTISMPASRIARADGPPEAAPASRRPERVRPGSDDDPLTSPSFPRITADDGRSYRRSRSDGPSRQAATAADYPGPGYSGSSYPEAGPSGWQGHPSWPSAGSAGMPAARLPGRPGDARPEPGWSEPHRPGGGGPARSDRVAADPGGWASQPGNARVGGGLHGAGQHDDGRYGGQYAGSPNDGAGYREAAAYPAGGYGPAAPAAVAYSAGDSGGHGTGYSGSALPGSALPGSGYPAAGYYAAPHGEAADTAGAYGPRSYGASSAGTGSPGAASYGTGSYGAASYGAASYGAGPQGAGSYSEPHYADAPYDQEPGYPQAASSARDERVGHDPYAADPYRRPGYGS